MHLNLNIGENENLKNLAIFWVKFNKVLNESNYSDET